jgi:adenosine deaminase
MTSTDRSYAELHLHLGGAVLPRILYTYLQRRKQDRTDEELQKLAASYIRKFPTFEKFERRLTRPCDTLEKYLEAHKLTEPLQSQASMAYFINRLLRGAFAFENIAYLELRYNPYFRIPRGLPLNEARDQMAQIVQTVAVAAQAAYPQFPIVFTQILCMDSRLGFEVNRAIVDLALDMPQEVCAVDIAGPDEAYRENLADIVANLKYAKESGLKTTGHCFETPDGLFPEILEFIDRIGHGIQIPLREPKLLTQVAKRKQCLEVCPTTYFRTGTIRSYSELKPVFQHCFDLGIDIAICTDNSAFHNVRLPLEFERLLTSGVLDFTQMERCRQAAFRHAFRWPGVIDQRRGVI